MGGEKISSLLNRHRGSRSTVNTGAGLPSRGSKADGALRRFNPLGISYAGALSAWTLTRDWRRYLPPGGEQPAIDNYTVRPTALAAADSTRRCLQPGGAQPGPLLGTSTLSTTRRRNNDTVTRLLPNDINGN